MKTIVPNGVLAIVLVGCLFACASSPPAPPQPDESTRQPVNSSVGIELETCEARLANSRLALEEATRYGGRASVAPSGATASCAAPGAGAAVK
jgi:hypothetical protein